jgi:hypothetical protein
MRDFLGERGWGKRAMPGGIVKTFSESIQQSCTMLEQEIAACADRSTEKAV